VILPYRFSDGFDRSKHTTPDPIGSRGHTAFHHQIDMQAFAHGDDNLRFPQLPGGQGVEPGKKGTKGRFAKASNIKRFLTSDNYSGEEIRERSGLKSALPMCPVLRIQYSVSVRAMFGDMSPELALQQSSLARSSSVAR
jgi:hypothetical protein